MTRPLTLYLPLAAFESLVIAANGRGKNVTINRVALAGLVMDHARVLAKLGDLQIETEESYAGCDTIRKART